MDGSADVGGDGGLDRRGPGGRDAAARRDQQDGGATRRGDVASPEASKVAAGPMAATSGPPSAVPTGAAGR